jgi:hypothetical protein
MVLNISASVLYSGSRGTDFSPDISHSDYGSLASSDSLPKNTGGRLKVGQYRFFFLILFNSS